MNRGLLIAPAAAALVAALASTPVIGQTAGDGGALEAAPFRAPDTSRIIIRRPRGDIIEPEAFRRGMVVSRQRGGHFRLDGAINGHPAAFLFDTGASTVVLTHKDAVAAGLPMDRLNFSIPIMTANGVSHVAPVRIREMTVGTITLNDVWATVAPAGALEVNLLGNTFLNRLGSFSVDGDRLLLTP